MTAFRPPPREGSFHPVFVNAPWINLLFWQAPPPYSIFEYRRAIVSRLSRGTAPGSIRSASTTNTEFAFDGRTRVPSRSKSLTITENEGYTHGSHSDAPPPDPAR
jgi:hypothetical protein